MSRCEGTPFKSLTFTNKYQYVRKLPHFGTRFAKSGARVNEGKPVNIATIHAECVPSPTVADRCHIGKRTRASSRGSVTDHTIPGIILAKLSLAGLSHGKEHALANLASAICPASAAYLAPRFRSYAYAVTAEDQSGLAAFELIDEFEEAGERYVYLGPLFSRNGACIPLVCDLAHSLLRTQQPFHLLAEAQNPEALLLFTTLFKRAAYPRLERSATPRRVGEIASTFARRLDHIHRLDIDNLSTHSAQTLYRNKPGCAAVLCWLARRGVHLDRGDSQVMVVPCSNASERARVIEDLRIGERQLKDWSRWRPRMLARFERTGHHA